MINMYQCLNVTVSTEALDILSKICSGSQQCSMYTKQKAMVILLRYVGSNIEIPNELVEQLLSMPNPVVWDRSVQEYQQNKYAHCLLHYIRKIWSDVGRVIRAQGVTINNIQVEVSCIDKAESILRCWEHMYSTPVALSSFKAFVCNAYGILSPLADKEPLMEYKINAAARNIAKMYLEQNDWYKATTEAWSPLLADKPSVLAPAVDNPDKYIQECFNHLHVNAEPTTDNGNTQARTKNKE